MHARTGILAFALAAVAGPLEAQAWDTPSFFAPRAHDDVGAYIIKPESGDVGVIAMWRQSGNINLGVRGGIGGDSDGRIILLGAELYGPLPLTTTGLPLLLAWNTGIGAGFDGVTNLRIPLGVSVGVELGQGTGVSFLPYVHPRATFDLSAFERANGEEETETEFNFEIDIGADIQLGERWLLRAGASLAESEVFGVGLAYRIPRPVAVR
ncbi:MAG: hypothetical protein ACRELX_00425 [Longimicrobiales bacterium]